jgi:hypothetical protein
MAQITSAELGFELLNSIASLPFSHHNGTNFEDVTTTF